MKEETTMAQPADEAGVLDQAQLLEFERLKVFQTVLEMICSASMDAVCIIDRTLSLH